MTATDGRASIVISLDFELRWGVHDVLGSNVDGYRANLEGVRDTVPAVLDVLRQRRLPATWATVGAVACRSWDDYFERAPAPPVYRDPTLVFDRRIVDRDPDGTLHFAPDLVRQVVDTPGQELATHTFSHLFLGEPGVVAADAIADHQATRTIFRERFGLEPRSLVYPRNQVAFWPFLQDLGLVAYRGNEAGWFHRLRGAASAHPVARSLRLLDGLRPRTRTYHPKIEGELPSTLFLRLGLPGALWRLHFAKVRRAVLTARPGHIVHLWFHPHNLGANAAKTLDRLTTTADFLAEQIARGQLVGRTMAEA